MLTPRKFDLLTKLGKREPLRLPTSGRADVRVASGTVTLEWSASALSAGATVTHGLIVGGKAVAPTAVVACVLAAPEPGKVPVPNVASKGSTTFSINAETKNSHTGKITLMWVAFA